MAHFFRHEERSKEAVKIPHERIEEHIDRVEGDYRGDILCLFFIATC